MKKRTSDKTKNVRVNVILRRVLVTIVAVEKQISITICEFASLALVIQHAMRMRHILFCGPPNCTGWPRSHRTPRHYEPQTQFKLTQHSTKYNVKW
jgi:hypothetical protein